MLSQSTKKVTITASSIVETEEKKVVLENYTATVDSENPENMSMNRFFPNAESKELYKDHRTECREDYAAFMEKAYALQDEMFAVPKK
jgi:hypothetical protein